jgi:hypothetical protein
MHARFGLLGSKRPKESNFPRRNFTNGNEEKSCEEKEEVAKSRSQVSVKFISREIVIRVFNHRTPIFI